MSAACRASLLLLLALQLFSSGCREEAKGNRSPQVVRMVTVLGRVTVPLAEALAKVLPDHFAARIEVKKIATTKDYLRLLQDGGADVAMIQTDLVYVAYTTGLPDLPGPQRRLRGIAVLYTSNLHLIASHSSHIRTLGDLRGKRVFLGTDGNTTDFTTRRLLEGVGLQVAEKQMSEEKVTEAFNSDQLDAAFIRGNDPSPNVQRIMQEAHVSLIPISRSEVEQIRSYHPFLHPTSILEGTYGNHPQIDTVGTDVLLTCRDDLPEELVYWITRTLFESLPGLANSMNLLRQIDLEKVPASPIPLHPGAARFYRERELFQ